MFLSKRSQIFENLTKQSKILLDSAIVFEALTNKFNKLEEFSIELEVLEEKADDLVQSISDDIEKIFILPLDKEDVKELIELLDDIIDNLEQSANRLKIYKITKENKPLKDFSKLIRQASEQIHQGMLLIKEHKLNSKEFSVSYRQIHTIEHEGDKVHRSVLVDLMNKNLEGINGNDILLIIKWKEIFQTLEDTLDKCEDIADLFERLKIKYG